MKCFDLQVNGGFGVDFSAEDLTADDFLRCSEKILRTGVTRFLPTIITSPWNLYAKRLEMLVNTIEKAGLQYEIPGFHLEGPFISSVPGAVGTHNPDWTEAPTPERVKQLFDWSRGKVRIITFAAELDGAKESVAEAKKLGIVPSVGHQMADEEQIASSGAVAFTHLGNGIPNQIDRHHNPIWSGLSNDDLTALVITDGHHLPGGVVKCFFRCKTASRICVISDASPAAGLPPGKYRVFGCDAVLEPDGLLHNPGRQCLAGSSAFLPQCMEFLRSLRILTEEEIHLCCWKNQHRLLNLED